jgi:hypothetical protein
MTRRVVIVLRQGLNYIAQAGLKFSVLSLPPACWDYSGAPHPTMLGSLCLSCRLCKLLQIFSPFSHGTINKAQIRKYHVCRDI